MTMMMLMIITIHVKIFPCKLFAHYILDIMINERIHIFKIGYFWLKGLEKTLFASCYGTKNSVSRCFFFKQAM